VDKIGEVIGPGGRNVKRITQETGATIDIREDGVAFVKGLTDESVNMAKQQVEMIVKERTYRSGGTCYPVLCHSGDSSWQNGLASCI